MINSSITKYKKVCQYIKNNNKIEISKEQAEEIFGDNGESLAIARKTVFCHNCFPGKHKSVEMKIERYYVNDLSDAILQGRCSVCDHPVARYVETGDNEETRKNAEIIWGNING